jgi:hypothetical protein
MIKPIARLLLLRVLPRRILPIVTVVEALLFLRGIRNRSRVRVNPPTRSRTAPPTSGPMASPTTASARSDTAATPGASSDGTPLD